MLLRNLGKYRGTICKITGKITFPFLITLRQFQFKSLNLTGNEVKENKEIFFILNMEYRKKALSYGQIKKESKDT